MDCPLKFGDHLTRPETFAIVVGAQNKISHNIQEADIFLNRYTNVWPQYFHSDIASHFLTGCNGREMHLCN